MNLIEKAVADGKGDKEHLLENVCPYDLGYDVNFDYCGNEDCDSCWNQPIEEEEK